jgi:tRNA (guanine37-N1)-methyltransferase
MRIFVLTLFPGMFEGILTHSILKRAIEKSCLEIQLYDIRDFARDKHKMTDDVPYGGGGGMVMKPEPIFAAVEHIVETHQLQSYKVIYLTPQGTTLTQEEAKILALEQELILLCGHYEEVDERVRIALIDQEISIGDYVLTGGELAAMVLIDVVARMIPEVIGNAQSVVSDSFYGSLLDYPHYTRPQEFRGMKVPEVLLSGNHKKIEEWRQQEALKRTKQRRPDLLSELK